MWEEVLEKGTEGEGAHLRSQAGHSLTVNSQPHPSTG